MKSESTSWFAIAAEVGLICALSAGGCSGSKGWQTDGPAPASADGAAKVDAPASDSPLLAGGAKDSGGILGSGGAIDYDAATGRGGSGGTGGTKSTGSGGAPGIDANTSGRDAALGGAGGNGQASGGNVGGRAGTGGAGGATARDGGIGSGGRTGGSSGTGGLGGNGGTGGATAKFDASFTYRDVAWWANDAGIKTCPANVAGMLCDVGGPSVCTVAGTYDTYQCNKFGVWVRQPDSCPGLLIDGDTCTGQFTCLYPSYWYCDCTAGMGFPAKCSDVRNLGVLDPRDAAPPIDTAPRQLSPCPSDPLAVTCDYSVARHCIQPNGKDLCTCLSAAWLCYEELCPATVQQNGACDATLFNMYCRGDDNTACICLPFNNTNTFSCGSS